MRVLIVTPLYPPDIGGPASYTRFIESELPQHGIETSVVSFTAVRHYPKLIRYVLLLFRIWREAQRVDLIFALDPVSVGLPARVVSGFTGVPLMLRISGDYAWEAKQLRGNSDELPHEFTTRISEQSLKIRLLHSIQRRVTGHATFVVTQTNYLRSVIAAWGIDEQKIAVIYTVLPKSDQQLTRSEARQKLGMGEDEQVALTAGRFIPLKRFDKVIEAFAAVSATIPQATLFIAGDGPERERLERLVEEKGLNEKVEFTGVVAREYLQVMLTATDVFVLNSTYETFPNIVLEAAAVGVKIIATAVGGSKELGELGINGLTLVPSGDQAALTAALIEALGTPQRYENDLKSDAMRRFDKTVVVDQLCEYIKQAAR